MRIRSVEITGFKSFADRVVLGFDRGISAIVGPNGCGKSNVVDAIRWVMGEQNPRHLRGRGMDDVIFAGSEQRPPVGMAEVVLVLDNSDGSAAGDYAGFSEIEVSRRLYRSGESEYLINKVPCRLRDVSDFFLDTGVGTRGYTIVEQGQIATIVSSRPEERRFIIEEAAGIGKYRARRRETERKLEATEQNLLRVNDVLGELRRQLGSLDRQAKKAARYKELAARLRELELAAAREELAQHDLRGAEVARQLEVARGEALAADARVARADAEIAEARREQLERERALQGTSEGLFAIRSEIQSLENRIEYERREREGLLRLAGDRDREIESLEAQLAGHRAEHANGLRELAAAEESLRQQEAELAQRDSALGAHTARVAGLRGRREALQTRMVELSAEGARLEGRRLSLEDRRRALELELRSEEELLETSGVQVDAASRDQEILDARLRRAMAEQDELGLQLAEGLRRLPEETTRLELLRTELAHARERLQHVEARIDALTEAERAEGSAIRAALERLPEAERRAVRGLLADAVQVEEGLERALEAVLAARLNAVLVSDPQAALKLLGRLRDDQTARATVLAVDAGHDEPASGFVPLGQRLLEKVSVKPPYDALVRRLLADVYLVDDLGEAVRRYGLQHPPAVFTTRDGELLDRSGALTGGAQAPAGALGRAAELRRQAGERERLVAERDRAQALELQQVEACGRLRDEIENLRSRRHTAELAVLHYEKDLEHLRERAKGAEESAESHRAGKARIADEIDRLGREGATLAASATALARERSETEASVVGLASELVRAARDVELEEQRGVQLRVALARQGARRDELRTADDRLRGAIGEESGWLERRREEVRSARERAESLLRSSSEASQLLAEQIRREESVRLTQAERRVAYDEISQRAAGADDESRAAAAAREELRSRAAALDLSEQEIRLRRDQLLERIRDRYQVDLASSAAASSGASGDPELRRAELAQLRQSLESLGDVHLGAIEEYEDVSERARYLAEQKQDLELSIERLREAISRINRTCRARFRETFDAVNAEFQKIFPRLFMGGRAHLALTESEDVLDAGLEIAAQPPGKKLQSINLLSGGEKSLCAIALLFAVFAVKPSPFFLLDEVDAALDDANVGRFNELVVEMARGSQFLLITHNKGTIEIAQRLYGITMEAPGLSKLVTVDLVS